AGRRRPRPRAGGPSRPFFHPGEPALSALLTSAGHLLAAAASGAATSPRPSTGGGFHFDPATTLGWAVPLMVMAPLAAFVIAISSVRTRRGSVRSEEHTSELQS